MTGLTIIFVIDTVDALRASVHPPSHCEEWSDAAIFSRLLRLLGCRWGA